MRTSPPENLRTRKGSLNPFISPEVVRAEELVDRFEGRLDTDGTNTLTKESMP